MLLWFLVCLLLLLKSKLFIESLTPLFFYWLGSFVRVYDVPQKLFAKIITAENPKLILICISQKYGKRHNQIKLIFQRVKLKTFEAV